MPVPDESDTLEIELRKLREAARPEIERRLQVIEGCLVAWQGGRIIPELVAVSQREAHRLAGSLGVLGFESATDLARQLNQILRSAPESAQVDVALDLVASLRRAIVEVPKPEAKTVLAPAASAVPRTLRVLLAEDDNTIAAAVRVSLQLDGLELLWARDGATAVQLAGEHDLDLVLLDLDLPVFDGFEVCKRLRADPRLATIPIVLVTGQPHLLSASGEPPSPCITAYLAKPFKVADLRQRVRSLLALHSPPADSFTTPSSTTPSSK